MNENINDKLNKGPVDVWSIRERLALASAVLRSGNQNWVSVSRSIKPFLDPGRPADWFSQINCARQYQDMLEKAGTSRRKRGDKDFSDTPGDVIVRKLVSERIKELRSSIASLASKYNHLKKEFEHIKSVTSGEKLKDMWQKLQMEKAASIEKIKDDQVLKILSSLKNEASTNQVLEPNSYVQEACEDTEQNTTTTTDSLSLNDDQLSQSTSSSHVTENAIPTDLPPYVESSSMQFDVEVKQEHLSNMESDVAKNRSNIANQGSENENKEDSQEEEEEEEEEEGEEEEVEELKQEVKVEVKDEPSEAVDDGKDDENIPELHRSEELEEVGEQVEEEIAMETQDVEDDIVISTEEIIEDANDNKSTPELSVVAQDLEDDDDDASNEGIVAATAPNLIENDASEDVHQREEDSNSKILQEEEMGGQSADVDKVAPVSPTLIPLETNIEEPKTHDSIDTEPSAMTDGVESKPTGQSKIEDDYNQTASVSSSPDAVGKVKVVQSSKQSACKTKAKRESKRKSTFMKAPKTPAIKEEGKESEISSKAGTSDDEEGKNLDEQVKATGSFVRAKLDLNESLPNSPASVCNSDTDDERNHKAWKKSIMLVWRAISNHKFANIFMHPVTEDIAPGYHNVIFKPMDLNAIRKNIDTGVIRHTRDFQRDMMLMFTNAIMYNHSSHDVHKMARVMYQDSMTQIEQFVNTQVMMRSEPKLLRTSRRSDTGISDKEEERKRKASEAEASTPVTTKKRRH